VDAYFWFATGEEDWRQPGSANGMMPSEGKWVCATPMLLGQWPAAALMYRLGYIRQGAPVVTEQRPLDELWQRKMPIIAEDAGYDPNRDQGNQAKESNVSAGINPLAYLVGPVLANYGGPPVPNRVTDLGAFIDTAHKTIRSVTGEITLNYGAGWCQLDTPKAQGVTGFLKVVGVGKLTDVEIRSTNDYATVLAVAMDNQPLKESGKILVQVGTTERPLGWQTKHATVSGRAGEEVVNFGHAPWMIVRAGVEISVANPALKTARVLDANGMQVSVVALESSGGRARFTFPPDALYVVLQK
jgi:hypothetical protein